MSSAFRSSNRRWLHTPAAVSLRTTAPTEWRSEGRLSPVRPLSSLKPGLVLLRYPPPLWLSTTRLDRVVLRGGHGRPGWQPPLLGPNEQSVWVDS
ncbi:hypothetical protein E2562_031505 [Oryza meyeriana var. granulata]|uniref:Uncharacterized protein n=1 Tax=Oryza meyeriana var. granulata TaxID=110450 RepID=A0A6G1ERQ0_9ORYZ|nr:hypothetical protein E2562_031505 [Oryza meyeriana var. granulata]